jgi:hypothetical protein
VNHNYWLNRRWNWCGEQFYAVFKDHYDLTRSDIRQLVQDPDIGIGKVIEGLFQEFCRTKKMPAGVYTLFEPEKDIEVE